MPLFCYYQNMKLIFATNNQHKLLEIRDALISRIKGVYELIGLRELNILEELPETGMTLEENALQKAKYIFDKFSFNCFADDTGLEVHSIDNRPGVFSARYAGIGCSYVDNVNKLLAELDGIESREARFRTVIALFFEGKSYLFEGYVNGIITYERRGVNGFGYDPIFQPNGFEETFAEMTLGKKNSISHRAIAVDKLLKFLYNPRLLENI
jgi:XTP/dITP diphosphohydrolase